MELRGLGSISDAGKRPGLQYSPRESLSERADGQVRGHGYHLEGKGLPSAHSQRCHLCKPQGWGGPGSQTALLVAEINTLSLWDLY